MSAYGSARSVPCLGCEGGAKAADGEIWTRAVASGGRVQAPPPPPPPDTGRQSPLVALALSPDVVGEQQRQAAGCEIEIIMMGRGVVVDGNAGGQQAVTIWTGCARACIDPNLCSIARRALACVMILAAGRARGGVFGSRAQRIHQHPATSLPKLRSAVKSEAIALCWGARTRVVPIRFQHYDPTTAIHQTTHHDRSTHTHYRASQSWVLVFFFFFGLVVGGRGAGSKTKPKARKSEARRRRGGGRFRLMKPRLSDDCRDADLKYDHPHHTNTHTETEEGARRVLWSVLLDSEPCCFDDR
jgi:hypothetical protein